MFRGTESNFSSHLIDQVSSYTLNLMRVSAGMRKTILGQLSDLEADLVKRLERTTGKTDFTAARLRTLIAQTRDTINTAYGDISQTHIKELRKVGKATMTNLEATINQRLHIPLISVAVSPTKLESIAAQTLIQGAQSASWWKQQASNLRNRFALQMRLGLYQGDDINKLVQRVRGTRAAKFADGLMAVSRREAEALVRTSVIAVANTSRLAGLLQNRDLIAGVQWVATLDSRTTVICIGLDGKVWKLPENSDPEDYGAYEPIDHDKQFPGPTAHWNCRSTQVPVLKSFDELKGEGGWDFGTASSEKFDQIFQRKLRAKGFSSTEAKKIHADTRASMDGQIGVIKGFEGWLEGKSDATQNEMLGKREAELFRDGKISLSELTDQSNRPISSDDLG